MTRESSIVTRALDVVLVEDSAADAELVMAALRRSGYLPQCRIVATEQDLLMALYHPPELVISDYSLPQLDGLRALELVASIDTDLPFILVSGTVSEELAVTALHRGAADYVPKDRLARLGPAVKRALELRLAKAATRRAESAIREREARLSAILDNEPECVKLVSADGELMEMNRAGLAMLEAGSVEEVRERGMMSFVAPGDHGPFSICMERVMAGETCTVEFAVTGMRGALRRLEMHAAPLRLPNDPTTRLLSVTRDVTAQRQTEAHLLRLNRMHVLLSTINSLIVRAHRRDELLHEATRLAAMHGEFDAVWIALLDPDTLELRAVAQAGSGRRDAANVVEPAPAPTDPQGFVARCLHSGRIVVAQEGECGVGVGVGARSAVALPLLLAGVPAGVVVLYARAADFFDEQELRLLGDLAADLSFALTHIQMREQAEFAAFHDTLTALPNRNLLVERAERALRASARRGSIAAIACFGIEKFWRITESVGRQTADELLRSVAGRLLAVTRREDTLARIGEKRFALLMEGITDPTEASTMIAERILPAFDAPFVIAGQEHLLRLTVGIAIGADDCGGEDLCANAERAAGSASTAAQPYSFYDPALNARVASSLALERRLRLALEREEFVLHYQPIVQASDGRLEGLEALIRWNDPARGLVSPAEFIHSLEETGLILEVGRWVLAQAVRDSRAWHLDGHRVPPIAVNVSALQLRDGELAREVVAALGPFPGVGTMLSIEITESLLVDNIEHAAAQVALLRDAGVATALDDFGTGYSSLAYIAELPVESLKIDRSFVARLAPTGPGRSVVAMMIALGHALGLSVVAEGVETEEQVRLLTELGCDHLQGFVIARPAPAAATTALLGSTFPGARSRGGLPR